MVTMATWFKDNVGFMSALFAITPDSDNVAVQMTWNMIVAKWFPGCEGFKYRLRPAITSVPKNTSENGGRSNAVIIQVIQMVDASNGEFDNWTEVLILQVECRRASEAGDLDAGMPDAVRSLHT